MLMTCSRNGMQKGLQKRLATRARPCHLLLLLAAWQLLHVAESAGQRSLQQEGGQPQQIIPFNPLNHTVKVDKAIYLPSTNIPGAAIEARAVYPDPILENPDGWRFKVIANASLVLGSTTTAAARIQSSADSKLAPAIALSSADLEAAQSVILLNQVGAHARPGLQYGVTLAKTDAKLVSHAPFNPASNISNGPVLMFLNQDAESGQGQAVNLVNAELEGNNLVVGDGRTRTWADRWYLAPGHAVSGQAWKIKGGQTAVYSKNSARASQGTATSGVMHYLHGRGNIPVGNAFKKFNLRTTRFLAKHGGLARADNRAFTDAGAAQAGNLQLVKSDNGDSTEVGLAQARTAEGNAAAGALNLAWAENGYIYIGDYWEELSNPGNAVVATNYGRGPAQAGQINIALTPNAGTRIGGTVVATAVQGSATSGAFTLANGYGELQTDEDVVAITSEYTASAGNVGVSVAHGRSAVINTAVAKTDTGSAISYDIASALVGTQNSAVGSSTATTSTGQAASLSASQAISGIQAESQAASLSKSTTGNALSVGDALSAGMYTARAVSTSGATTQEGTAVSSGWAGVVSADSEAATASSAVTSGAGNAGSVAQGYGLGIFEGKGTAASSAGARDGSTGSLALGVGTGLILSDATTASTAQSADGNAMALSGSLALGGLTSRARASSVAQSGTGDVSARADALGLGSLHGEADARSVSATGCSDCVSDAVANAVSVGFVADSTAQAKSDTPINPGNALANAMAFGYISRTRNDGSSRVSIGPGQALTGGFAVSAPRRIADAAAAAAGAKDLAKKAAAVHRQQQGHPQALGPATRRPTPVVPQQQQQQPAAWPPKPQPLSWPTQQGSLKNDPAGPAAPAPAPTQATGAQPSPSAAAAAAAAAAGGAAHAASVSTAANPGPPPAPASGPGPQQSTQTTSRQFGTADSSTPPAGAATAAGSPPAPQHASGSKAGSSKQLLQPGSVPGSGFLSGLLKRLEQTVKAAEEIGATPSLGEKFSGQHNLPLFPLQPEKIQEEEAKLEQQGKQPGNNSNNSSSSSSADPAERPSGMNIQDVRSADGQVVQRTITSRVVDSSSTSHKSKPSLESPTRAAAAAAAAQLQPAVQQQQPQSQQQQGQPQQPQQGQQQH